MHRKRSVSASERKSEAEEELTGEDDEEGVEGRLEAASARTMSVVQKEDVSTSEAMRRTKGSCDEQMMVQRMQREKRGMRWSDLWND